MDAAPRERLRSARCRPAPGAPDEAPRGSRGSARSPPEASGCAGESRRSAPLAIQPDAPAIRRFRRCGCPRRSGKAPSDPGTLWVRLGTFQGYQYAAMQQATVAGLGAQIANSVEGRVRTYRVTIGPLASVAQADAVLDQVIRAGVTDARIVVE